MKSFGSVPLLFFLVACTHEQVYNAVQDNQQMECSKLPQVRYEACMKNFDESYQDYERERQGLLKKESQ